MATSPSIERFLSSLRLDRLQTLERLVTVAKAVSALPWGEGRTIDEVLETKRVGTCTGKHLVLQACFDALSIEWRPAVCTFRWSEQGILLPNECRRILESGEWNHGHNFVQIRNGTGEWADLDITWDPPLTALGFRCLPDTWNGMTPFVGLKSLVVRWDGISMQEKKKELIEGLSPTLRENREEFLQLFIRWIASLRK